MAASKKRSKLALKIIGIALVLAGIALVVIGLVDLFTIIGDLRMMPKLFWCLFVGFPVILIGAVLTVVGFRRDVTAPYVNDTDDDNT